MRPISASPSAAGDSISSVTARRIRPRSRRARLSVSRLSRIIDLDGYAYTPLYTPRRARATIERVERAVRAFGRDATFLAVYYGSGSQWQTLDVPLRTVTTHDRFALVRPDGNVAVMRCACCRWMSCGAAMGFP
jgi:hypothetical protein